ncbi:winged helix-turn-helix domain-containing protein [Kitasatospora sp. MAP5-34]|uniref:ArsR/SmtB family transcription factor n=1 Tax=Kitasatospora sp. MAP5-34 TaxID=3035102 RepID=UPI002475C8B0|nr:winged helix-turn-helix domain-containing protein [Kitasatospora sp. MAP5-34]MDH6576922.1 DNA-binding transcriptional ArsR family regulator [Kitasatospora sp. MAP5-34]
MPEHPSYPPPPEDVQEIGAPEQFAALAHQLRQRLLFALSHRPATIRQLAAQLDATKGNVAHHLKVLREAGLVHVAETRQVRGGTEQYYQRTARRIAVAEPQAAGTAAMLGAVAQELDRSPAETLSLRHLRLSPTKARQLGELLTRLVDEAEEEPEDQPVHGVLVALYQHFQPDDAEASGGVDGGVDGRVDGGARADVGGSG